MLPAWHGGHGLLKEDAIIFHQRALDMAEQIRLGGWSAWRLFPAEGMTGNVGLLGALYAVLGPNPAWFIPFNAAAHATAALMLYLIGPLLWPGRVGLQGGLMAALLFVLFPSALLWYGQVHKDAFAIAGTLILLYAWLQAVMQTNINRSWLKLLMQTGIGTCLILFVRPYFLSIVVAALAVSWFVLAATSLIRRSIHAEWPSVGCSLFLLVFVIGLSTYAQHHKAIGSADREGGYPVKSFTWEYSTWIPVRLDETLREISEKRAGFIAYGKSVQAGSLIDADRSPGKAIDALAYMPRALAIALFSPFPSTWGDKLSLPRVIGALETCVWYLLIPGVLLLVLLRPSRPLLAGAIFCCAVLVVISYAIPNIGTLYRMRFGLLFFFLLCGLVGWSRFILDTFVKERVSKFESTAPLISDGAPGALELNAPRVGGSSGSVLWIGLVTYLAFAVRDLVLIRSYGISAQLDAFYVASMIPMFFVGFLSLPFMDALIPQFMKVYQQSGMEAGRPLIRALLTFLSAVLVVVGIFLISTSDTLITHFMGDAEPSQIHAGSVMLRWLLLTLIFSGVTVVGNGVLNALRRPLETAIAQMCVPFITILTILVFSEQLGIDAAIYGILAGMAVNILMLINGVSRQGGTLIPGKVISNPESLQTIRNYFFLSLTALLMTATIPVNYYFSGQVGGGQLSVWAIGTKLVQILTGITGMALSFVLLPYLASLVVQKRQSVLKGDVFTALAITTWLSLICVVMVQIFSAPVIAALIAGAADQRQADQLVMVLKLGSLQLPFLVSITIFLKLAAVSNGSMKAAAAGVAMLGLNILFNLLLVRQYGVIGVAIAAAASCALSAIWLAVSMRKLSGMGERHLTALVGGWLALLTFCGGLFLANATTIVTSVMALSITAWLQWQLWLSRDMQHLTMGHD